MPTINLNNNSNPQNTASPAVAPATNPTTSPVSKPAPVQNGWSDWNDPWQDDNQNNANKPGKNMTPQERVGMIEKVYQEILGRNPDTRDINYYKYSTLGEEEIKKQLITGNEHKQLLADGRDYKKVKERALQAETRVKMLEGQILDQVEEFRQLTNLLREKNKHISELRQKTNIEKSSTPFTPQTFANKPNEVTSNVHFSNPEVSEKPTPQPKTEPFIEKMRKKLKDML